MRRPSTFIRYLVLQLPGLALLALLVGLAGALFGLPLGAGAAILVAWIAKDLAIYPFVRPAYETDTPPPLDRLLGQSAIVVSAVDPTGYVRVGGELWRASAAAGAPLETGTRVRVVAAERMTLTVARMEPSDSSPTP